jgi:hypothetical protein
MGGIVAAWQRNRQPVESNSAMKATRATRLVHRLVQPKADAGIVYQTSLPTAESLRIV